MFLFWAIPGGTEKLRLALHPEIISGRFGMPGSNRGHRVQGKHPSPVCYCSRPPFKMFEVLGQVKERAKLQKDLLLFSSLKQSFGLI